MTKPLFLFVGPSGSGKTTIVEELAKKYNYPTVESFTTRPRRYENETGHIFISEEDFDNLNNIVAYTKYNNYRYCTTQEQLDLVLTYVVDIPGVETLLQNYKSDRTVIVFYFDSTVKTRIDRMRSRNDDDVAILNRLYNDEAFDWYDKLDKIIWHYQHIENKNVELFVINANLDKDKVLDSVYTYMEEYIN